MADLLRGRQRRYFGYNRDVQHKVDTPESAKSYRSIMSPVTRKLLRKYEPVKSFKPDPPGHKRFADKIIHRAVKTQIPGLLPALKNSPQFDEFEDNPIYLRSPEFEQHFKRSLHHFWLPKPDRSELCGIFNRHLKAKEKERLLGAKNVWSTKKRAGRDPEVVAEEQREFLDQAEHDPRLKARAKRVSEVPSRLLRQNRKFQMSYWNPAYHKGLLDPFNRKKNKVPAFDAICHEHFGQADRDLLTCLTEYRIRYELNQDLNADDIELNEGREHLRRISLFGNLEEEEKRRGYKHIKQLQDFDRESKQLWENQAKLMIAAAEYINKIKLGRRFPTPPREIMSSRGGTDESRRSSAINIEDYLDDKMGKPSQKGGKRTYEVRRSRSPRRSQAQDMLTGEKKHKHKKHRHHHHDYNSEEFYMEMYLHFLNPEEDVSLKPPARSLTDIKELRRKMNLDEDHEKERKLVELLNADSVEALHMHGTSRKTFMPHNKHTVSEIFHDKGLLEHHLKRLNNPRLTHLLTRMASQMSLTSSNITMTDSNDSGERDASPPMEGEGATTPLPQTGKSTTSIESGVVDDDLDAIGDVPENELRLIMSEIAAPSRESSSSENVSSGSSAPEDEEEAGEVDGTDDEIKLFKKVRRKKDSIAEFMDLTDDFRAAVCKAEEGRPPGKMNPFAEAVCVLYPDGPDKKGKHKANKKKSLFSAQSSLKKI